MFCQYCLVTKSPSHFDLPAEFFQHNSQLISYSVAFAVCKQIKVENEQHIQLCTFCKSKLESEYTSKQSASVQPAVRQDIKKEDDDELLSNFKSEDNTEEITFQITLSRAELDIGGDSVKQSKPETLAYQIVYPEVQIKEEPELQIDGNYEDEISDSETLPDLKDCGPDYNVTVTEHLKKYRCPQCEQTFDAFKTLQKHITIHNSCPKCPGAYKKPLYLAHHMLLEHPVEKCYQCHHCHHLFANKEQLKPHILLHLEKKYKCSQCDACFQLPTLLKDHVLARHAKIYECPKCLATYKSEYGVKIHVMKRHSKKSWKKHKKNQMRSKIYKYKKKK